MSRAARIPFGRIALRVLGAGTIGLGLSAIVAVGVAQVHPTLALLLALVGLAGTVWLMSVTANRAVDAIIAERTGQIEQTGNDKAAQRDSSKHQGSTEGEEPDTVEQ